MGTILIVDGHSALHALEELRRAHEENPRHGRQLLVDWLSVYQGATETSVVIVFDGQGRERGKEGGTESEALVLYSRAGESADTVIERLASVQARRHRVTVASNDRLVLDAAMASGAEAISISGLEESVEETLGSFRDRWGLR